MRQRLILWSLALTLFFAVSGSAFAAVYDLGDDWSDVNNPNGEWSYAFTTTDGTTSLLESGTFTWESTIITDQTAWVLPSGSVGGLFQSNGTGSDNFDWVTGDIITHTPSPGYISIFWTSAEDVCLSITGSLWATRNNARTNNWTFYLNGTELESGTLNYSSSQSVDLGSLTTLSNLLISDGDVIELRIGVNSGYGDYAGIDLTMTTMAVPVPSGILLLLPGLAGLCLLKRNRERT